MTTEVTINNIVGQSPYDVYICQEDGTGCFYISTISSTPYNFQIPEPFNNLNVYMLKVIDDKGCVITGIESVGVCP